MNTKIEQIQNNVKTLLDCYTKHNGKQVSNTTEEVEALALFFTNAFKEVQKWIEEGAKEVEEEQTTLGQYFCKRGIGSKQDWYREDCAKIQKLLTFKSNNPYCVIKTTLGNRGDDDFCMFLRYNFNNSKKIDMFLTLSDFASIYINDKGIAKISLA